jgi:membrane protein DedA with SNARE-associated domain
MEYLVSFLTRHAYGALLLGVVGENLGLPLPGEIFVLLAAAMVNQVGLSLSSIVLVAALGAMLGDHGSYLIGRKGGRQLLSVYCHATLCSRDCGSMAGRFFQRFGGWTVVLARFVPGLRAFAVPFAGMTQMSYWKFAVADFAGAVSWATLITGLGAVFGSALANVLNRIIRFGAILFLLLVAALALTIVFRLRRVRRHGVLTATHNVPDPLRSTEVRPV